MYPEERLARRRARRSRVDIGPISTGTGGVRQHTRAGRMELIREEVGERVTREEEAYAKALADARKRRYMRRPGAPQYEGRYGTD